MAKKVVSRKRSKQSRPARKRTAMKKPAKRRRRCPHCGRLI